LSNCMVMYYLHLLWLNCVHLIGAAAALCCWHLHVPPAWGAVLVLCASFQLYHFSCTQNLRLVAVQPAESSPNAAAPLKHAECNNLEMSSIEKAGPVGLKKVAMYSKA
jgi:hypothetical protein